MKFIDEIEINVASGKGGRGMVSFHSDHGRAKLGADGGDGGFGGSVYLVGNPQLNTLSGLNYHHEYRAEDGAKGGSSNKTGRSGNDLEIPVPLGTIAYNRADNSVVAEVTEAKQRIIIAKGGKRGIGNARFLSPWHQAPEEFTPGGDSQEIEIKLELKLMADVGFAGLPNAGKSSLLSVLSAARPKIADYPFTTLIPHLGVVQVDDAHSGTWGASFVAADIPGLIAGAAQGRGLGHAFLRHIERTKALAFVLDASEWAEMEPKDAFKLLQNELKSFDASMMEKQFCIILSKVDAIQSADSLKKFISYFKRKKLTVVPVSSLTGAGIDELKRVLFDMCVRADELSPRAPTKSRLADASAALEHSFQDYTLVSAAEPLPL